MKSGTEYTVSYSAMRGVDFSSDDGELRRYRFSYLENMYQDYEGGGAGIIESIPGFRKVLSTRGRVHSIFTHRNGKGTEYAVIHAADKLYRASIDALVTNAAIPEPIASICDKKSRGFASGCDLYVLDGEDIVKVDGEGVATRVSDGSITPYVPTTYYNGTELEQRNLLTNSFREKYLISASSDMATESHGLKYRIISSDACTVAVSGIEEGVGGEVNIPAYIFLSGIKYRVAQIDEKAFEYNEKITRVTVSETVTSINTCAFHGCDALREVIISDSVQKIRRAAFFNCPALESFYLGLATTFIDVAVFTDCPNLKSINYAGDEFAFSMINIDADMTEISVNHNVRYNAISVEIPIFTPAVALKSVTLGGADVGYSVKTENEIITAIVINAEDKSDVDGKEVTINGISDDGKFTLNSAGNNFIAQEGSSISGRDAILGCRVCESFDGRVFISGNPRLPNTVFYSTRDDTGKNNPTYFGILNYFNDGVGSFSVQSLLAAGESLAVFKSGDDGGGSIYYHTPRETGIGILPKIYPVSYIHSGISAIGDSVSFFDDRLFLSALGLTSLDKQAINLERSIGIRSHNVNRKLLSENLEEISITKWCGYLALCAEGRIYLADSRQTFTHPTGHTEYEWYFLSGIGTYSNERKVFKYASCAKEGYATHPNSDARVTETVYLSMEGDEVVCYTKEGGVKYAVYTDGENVEGVFNPACCVLGTGNDLLFFGTENGDVCVFNNDKRGVPPPWLKEQEGFDENEYREHFGKRIHPYYYSFAFHAPRYALSTVSDNGGFPNLTKSTVKHTLAIKLLTIGHGNLYCEVGTDRTGYKEISKIPDGALNFDELDFSALTFTNTEYTTLPIKEREKGWIEKSMSFYSNEYSSPFGIYSITYRFEIKGKIKN